MHMTPDITHVHHLTLHMHMTPDITHAHDTRHYTCTDGDTPGGAGGGGGGAALPSEGGVETTGEDC